MLIKTKVRIASKNSLRLKLKIVNDVILLAINFLITIMRIKSEY